MLSIRPTFDAKHVTIKRFPLYLENSSVSAVLTSVSEGMSSSTKTFVESPIRAVIFSFLNAFKAFISTGLPTTGSSSKRQSPVWNTVPCGVLISNEHASGIEWVIANVSTSNGFSSSKSPCSKTFTSARPSNPASSSLVSSISAAKADTYTGQRSNGQKEATAPMWSSCACVMISPFNFGAIFSAKEGSGISISIPGKRSPANPMPQSTASQLPSQAYR